MQANINGDLIAEIGYYWINKNGYPTFKTDILVHRYIAEKVLGRPLKNRELVHHLDGNKLNNTKANLVICPNDSYHSLLHARTNTINDGYSPETHHYCTNCKEYHIKELFPKNKNAWDGLHNMCKESSNIARRGKGYGKFTWKERMFQQFHRANKKGLVTCLDKEGRCL